MNRKNPFVERIESSPIIAATRTQEDIRAAIDAEVEVIFLLGGDILTLPDQVACIHSAGKLAVVHLDLVAGLSAKDAAVDYLHKAAHADGIITTRSSVIPHAKELGLGTILRYFVLDSMAVEAMHREGRVSMNQRPDVLEILPGVLAPRIMQEICGESRIPVIAGGLIKDREDVVNALNNGCMAISTSNREVWGM